jgi:xanthine dehydrogenase YagR molybdenum-binding subunit
VICPFVGGAFGTSLRTWPHVTLSAMAAHQVQRPVKLVLTRRQMFFATGHRPRCVQRVALGASPRGELISLIHEASGETSRYEEFIEALTAASGFMYSCSNVRTRYRLVPLDTSTPTFMRGPGEASGVFALECAMDELSYTLQIDPIELRRRNETAVDQQEDRPFSSRSLVKCYDVGAERFGWSRRDPRPRSMRDGRLLVGIGMAATTYPAIHSPASARARLLASGIVEIEVAASDMGPGTTTSLTQVAADALGLPVEWIRLSIGCSDFPPAPPHGGSQTMASVGSAVQAVCLSLKEEVAKRKGTDRRDSIEAQASARRDPEVARRYSMHAFGAVFAEVAVDPDVGTIQVRRALGVYAAGRIINPRLAASQCLGGMVGGIGMALMERTLLDARDGRPVNAHMADYLVPVNLDIAQLDAQFIDELDPYVNALGVKGIGEIALVGMAPAIANAVYHATGRRIRHLPIRIEDVLGE